MKYKCLECEEIFNEPLKIETSYEVYYGAPIDTYTYLSYDACPYCVSEHIEEVENE